MVWLEPNMELFYDVIFGITVSPTISSSPLNSSSSLIGGGQYSIW